MCVSYTQGNNIEREVKNMTTISESENLDLIFLMDRSGSMGGFEKDTIGGFNSFIQREKAKELNTTVTTVCHHDRRS